MKTRVDQEKAYLLHRRPYSETSIIGYFFTREHGIVHILIRGAKRKKGNYTLLQPTMELLVSWSGKSELKTMRSVELSQRHNIYDGKQLTILLYLTELLLKLLKPFDAHTALYDYYHNYLTEESKEHNEVNLRILEQRLFAELGYGLSYDKDYKSGVAITPDKHYIYEPNLGFTVSSSASPINTFSGTEIFQMDAGDFTNPAVGQAAKRLARLIIHHLMEYRQLSSRKLIQPLKNKAGI